MDLTLEQALNNVVAVCAVYKGDLKEHQVIQESLKLIKANVEASLKEDPKAE